MMPPPPTSNVLLLVIFMTPITFYLQSLSPTQVLSPPISDSPHLPIYPPVIPYAAEQSKRSIIPPRMPIVPHCATVAFQGNNPSCFFLVSSFHEPSLSASPNRNSFSMKGDAHSTNKNASPQMSSNISILDQVNSVHSSTQAKSVGPINSERLVTRTIKAYKRETIS